MLNNYLASCGLVVIALSLVVGLFTLIARINYANVLSRGFVVQNTES